MLIHQLLEVDTLVFDHFLNVISSNDYQEIAEERVALRRCCNLRCPQFLSDDHVNKVISRKFIILKGGHKEENKDPRDFCGKVSPNEKSKCQDAYLQQVQSIEVNADGGPFNTSLDPVMAYFERMEEDLLPVDKIETIRECIKEFKQERGILGGPIVEKKYIVPSQD